MFEIARLLVRLDHIARVIVNANHSGAVKLGEVDCVADWVWLAIIVLKPSGEGD